MKDPQAFLQQYQAGIAASPTVDLLGPANQTGGAGDLPDLSGGSPSVYIRPDRASLADHALVANRIGVLSSDNTAVTYDLSAEETEALSPPAGREAIAYVVTVRVTLHDLTVHVFDGGPLTIFAASTIDLTPTPVPAPVPTPIVTVHTNWVGVKNAAGDFAAADLTVSRRVHCVDVAGLYRQPAARVRDARDRGRHSPDVLLRSGQPQHAQPNWDIRRTGNARHEERRRIEAMGER